MTMETASATSSSQGYRFRLPSLRSKRTTAGSSVTSASSMPLPESSLRRIKMSKKQQQPRHAEEEKKESSFEFMDNVVTIPNKAVAAAPPTTKGSGTSSAGTIGQDSFFDTLPSTIPSVAELWREVTWYPVVESEAESKNNGTSPKNSEGGHRTHTHSPSKRMPYRRWMAVQGALYTDDEDDDEEPRRRRNGEQSRPIYRHAHSWHGEPFRAEPFSPLITSIRQALQDKISSTTNTSTASSSASPLWNHVSLECMQWSERKGSSNSFANSPAARRKSVTVAHERIDPTLDLEPKSPASIRVFLTGPLSDTMTTEDEECIDEKEEGNGDDDDYNSSDELIVPGVTPGVDDDDDDKTLPTNGGGPRDGDNNHAAAEAKAKSPAKKEQAPPPEPQRLGTIYLRPKRYDRNNKRRESPRPRQSVRVAHNSFFALGWNTNGCMTHEISLRPPSKPSHIAIMITFRQVATWLVETEGRVPRVVSRLHPLPGALHSEEDRTAEHKRLMDAFFEEKRQDGLRTEHVYEGGSLLVPTSKTKPCLSRHVGGSHHDHEDTMSVATPTSVSSLGFPSSFSISTPIHNINVLDTSDRADDDNLHLLGNDQMSTEPTASGNAMALLIVDLQNDFIGDDPSFLFSKMGSNGVSPLGGTRRTRLLKRIGQLAQEVRDQKGVVVFCRSVYGRWSQSAATRDKMRGSTVSVTETTTTDTDSVYSASTTSRKAGARLDRSSICSVGTAGGDFHPEATKLIHEEDIVVTKQWYSAFLETSLHAQLQRLGVQSVVVCGVTTNHSVMATVRSAAHLGYHVIVSSDGTAQLDPSLQAETEAKLQSYAAILAPQMALKEFLSPDPVTPRSLHQDGQDRLDFDGWNRLSAVGSGDSILLPDFFDPEDAASMLRKLVPSRDGEVTWKLHTERGGRAPLLTAYQCGRNEAGHAPIFRMATLDGRIKVTDWTPSVNQARLAVEEHSGHSFNWVRLLHHATAKDSVRFRSDMCLDMQEDAHVAIAALGEGLVLELRPKPGVASSVATAQKIYLRHNAVFLLGPETNRLFQYSIRWSRKTPKNRLGISLTFRELITFQYQDESNKRSILYGPGTEYKNFQRYKTECQRNRMWEGAGLVACGASSLALLHGGSTGSSRLTDQLALAAAPVLGLVAVYEYMAYRRKSRARQNEARLEETFVRCNWQPLKFAEAKRLFLNATDEELFGHL